MFSMKCPYMRRSIAPVSFFASTFMVAFKLSPLPALVVWVDVAPPSFLVDYPLAHQHQLHVVEHDVQRESGLYLLLDHQVADPHLSLRVRDPQIDEKVHRLPPPVRVVEG